MNRETGAAVMECALFSKQRVQRRYEMQHKGCTGAVAAGWQRWAAPHSVQGLAGVVFRLLHRSVCSSRER